MTARLGERCPIDPRRWLLYVCGGANEEPVLLLDTFTAPRRALGQVGAGVSVMPALVAATLAALVHAAVLVPRLDVEAVVEQRHSMSAQEGKEAPAAMTPHEREEAVVSQRKLTAAGVYAWGLLGSTLQAFGVALALWLAFKVAGVGPAFRSTFAVASYGLLPLGLAKLLSLPALLGRGTIAPTALAQLLPSHLGVLLPPGSSGPLAGLLGSINLFSLWSLVLVIMGMAAAARTSTWRASVVTVVMWLSYVAVFGVALAAVAARAQS